MGESFVVYFNQFVVFYYNFKFDCLFVCVETNSFHTGGGIFMKLSGIDLGTSLHVFY